MSLEETVERLLKGEGLEVTELHFAPEQKPVTRKNTCFAVCAVIFNSKVMSKMHTLLGKRLMKSSFLITFLANRERSLKL